MLITSSRSRLKSSSILLSSLLFISIDLLLNRKSENIILVTNKTTIRIQRETIIHLSSNILIVWKTGFRKKLRKGEERLPSFSERNDKYFRFFVKKATWRKIAGFYIVSLVGEVLFISGWIFVLSYGLASVYSFCTCCAIYNEV